MAAGVGVSDPDKFYCPPALLVQWLTGRGETGSEGERPEGVSKINPD